MIKMIAIGHLGRDCTVNTVNGKNVINFALAHTEKWKDAQGNNQERTTWIDCSYWTDRTAISPYLVKGTQVFVEGQPDARGYTKNDGTAAVALTLRVGKVELLGGKKSDSTTASQTRSTPAANTQSDSGLSGPPNIGSENEIDDLPF